MELDTGNKSGEYKMKAIYNSAVYTKKSKSGHLLELHHLVFWKSYLKEENIWKPALAVQHFKKLIRLFHKNHSDKLTATFDAIDTALLMARPTI